ncbi:MAG TPA: cupin domain-containing protein [Thermomicrobiales bacterium]|nr:cupin domain-containing protein [Thermomicrobiales bacterium]
MSTNHERSPLGVAPFPSAVGLSHLRVYDTVAPDGQPGGSPHMHFASAEAYVVIAGQGSVETLSLASGAVDFDLSPGRIVWFEPGVIHRLVNRGGLEITVVMQNAGLPEAGDAVFAFGPELMAETAEYDAVAGLGDGPESDRLARAMRRRDAAVEGFTAMRAAARTGDLGPLCAFLAAAVALRRELVPSWRERWRDGPAAETELTRVRLDAVAAGSPDLLAAARVHGMGTVADHPGIGMCGRLDTYLPDGIRTLTVPDTIALTGKD